MQLIQDWFVVISANADGNINVGEKELSMYSFPLDVFSFPVLFSWLCWSAHFFHSSVLNVSNTKRIKNVGKICSYPREYYVSMPQRKQVPWIGPSQINIWSCLVNEKSSNLSLVVLSASTCTAHCKFRSILIQPMSILEFNRIKSSK